MKVKHKRKWFGKIKTFDKWNRKEYIDFFFCGIWIYREERDVMFIEVWDKGTTV